MDMGTLIHRLVLGAGPAIHVVEAGDYRTKAAREARETARADGKIPVLIGAVAEANTAALVILDNLRKAGILLNGESEAVILWQEQAAHGPIWCRAMIDHVVQRDGRLVVYDLKTTKSAHPKACQSTADNFGYDIQQEAYTRAAEALWPEYAGRVDFVFLFAEPAPPYAVTPARLDGIMRERGRRRWAYAVEKWARCLHTDTWPAYTAKPVTLESPSWLLQRETEASMALDGNR